LEKDAAVNQVKEALSQIKGVGYSIVLTEEDRNKISEMEAKADEMTLMGIGRGDNKGVKEVLKSDILLAFTTNMDYVWPPLPNVILMQHDKVVGEDVDEEKLQELAACKDNLIIGNIVLYDKGVLSSVNGKREPLVVVLPAKDCHEIEGLSCVAKARLASPSSPTDEYLKERMCQSNECGTGTFLLGCDVCDGV
jgi:hypothetical protein